MLNLYSTIAQLCFITYFCNIKIKGKLNIKILGKMVCLNMIVIALIRKYAKF